MKTWLHSNRGFLSCLASLVIIHELLLWFLAGRDVLAVLLAPNSMTPLFWAALAVMLLLTRLLLFFAAPACLAWRITEGLSKPKKLP